MSIPHHDHSQRGRQTCERERDIHVGLNLLRFPYTPLSPYTTISWHRHNKIHVQPKLHNINPPNITHSLESQNHRERMFIVQISLLIVTLFSLISQISSLMQTTKEVDPHYRMAPCVIMWSCLLRLLLVEGWCMYMPRCLGRSSGVDHTNRGERRMNLNPIVPHATLSLSYHASMLTIQNSLISRALWLPQVWYYGD